MTLCTPDTLTSRILETTFSGKSVPSIVPTGVLEDDEYSVKGPHRNDQRRNDESTYLRHTINYSVLPPKTKEVSS